MKKNDKEMVSGVKVKLGTTDKVIRGVGYIVITLYALA